MGPHFFKCGKFSQISGGGGEKKMLQWGRTFSSAEREFIDESNYGQFGRFNGAALFQVRKALPCNLLKDSWFYGGLRELFYFLD